MWIEMSSSAILQEIGRRFKELRVRKDIQQETLTEMSGVSISVIIRFEKGENVGMKNVIKLLRAVDLLENLEQLIPEQPISPLQLKKLQKKRRERATRKS